MILPIVAYGDPVLRKKGIEIDKDYPGLTAFIANMKDTMYEAHGVGLAAPQVGKAIRLFVIDASPFVDEDEMDEDEIKELENFNHVFINPVITEESGEEWVFNEGCLSIPNVREDVKRKPNIVIEYLDENFEEKTMELSGLAARVVQHEYDHIEGILFTDKLSSLKKKIIKSKLTNISKGKMSADYKIRFFKSNKTFIK